MAEDVAVNDNTNEPQPQSETVATPADPAETMLGGQGTTAEQKPQEEAPAEVTYDFKATIPEGVEMDEAITKEYSDIARSLHMTNEQANQVAALGIKYGQQFQTGIHKGRQNNRVYTNTGKRQSTRIHSNRFSNNKLCKELYNQSCTGKLSW